MRMASHNEVEIKGTEEKVLEPEPDFDRTAPQVKFKNFHDQLTDLSEGSTSAKIAELENEVQERCSHDL